MNLRGYFSKNPMDFLFVFRLVVLADISFLLVIDRKKNLTCNTFTNYMCRFLYVKLLNLSDKTYSCSNASVLVVWSQTELGPQY